MNLPFEVKEIFYNVGIGQIFKCQVLTCLAECGIIGLEIKIIEESEEEND